MTTQSIATKSISFVGYWIRLCILFTIIVSVFTYRKISAPETITCWVIIACGALHLIIMVGEPLMELTQAERYSVGNTTSLSNLLLATWVILYCGELIHNKDVILTLYSLQSVLFVMLTARTWQNLGTMRLLQVMMAGVLLWIFVSNVTNQKR